MKSCGERVWVRTRGPGRRCGASVYSLYLYLDFYLSRSCMGTYSKARERVTDPGWWERMMAYKAGGRGHNKRHHWTLRSKQTVVLVVVVSFGVFCAVCLAVLAIIALRVRVPGDRSHWETMDSSSSREGSRGAPGTAGSGRGVIENKHSSDVEYPPHSSSSSTSSSSTSSSTSSSSPSSSFPPSSSSSSSSSARMYERST